MASDVYPVSEVHRTITRPITIEILRQMLKYTGLNPADFRTKMTGMAEAEKVPGSYLVEDDTDEFTHNKIDKNPNRLTTDRKLTIEIDDEITGDLITPVRYPDAIPVFLDKDLRIKLTPVYSLVKTTISVILNVRDKGEAKRWIREVKSKTYQSALTHYHAINYHYTIPHQIGYYLVQMHRLREQVDGLGEDFGHWLKRCFDKKYDIATALDGEEKSLVIREKQVNIPAGFDFNHDVVKAEKESDNAGGWQVQFDYSFHWQRPDNLVFEYPLMVHNQPLPEPFINMQRPEHHTSWNHYRSYIQEAFDEIALYGNVHGRTLPPGIPDPIWDDWYPKDTPYRHTQISRTLVSVDPNDKKAVIAIDDLSELFQYKEGTLRVLRTLGNLIVKRNYSPILFQMQKWNSTLGENEIEAKDIYIRTKEDMSFRDMYHVTSWVLTDISLLEPDAWLLLLNNCDAFHEWLQTIYPFANVDMIRCNTDNTVNIDDFKKWWDEWAPGTDDISGNLKPGPGLPWADCVGTYCVLKPDWVGKRNPGGNGLDPDGERINPNEFKQVYRGGIIARRLEEGMHRDG